MELNINITEDDYVNFNIINYRNSKELIKRSRLMRFLPIIFFMILPLFLSNHIPLWYRYIWFIIASIFYVFYYPKSEERSIRKLARKMISEDKKGSILGERKIIIDETGVKTINTNDESITRWNGIEKVLVDKNYILIYNSPVSAYILPIRELAEEKEEVLKLLNEYVNNRMIRIDKDK
ncbi:hypothetical protein Curi_c17960 [Gottschalkia acidurici 9a]|uniref:YcxB-like C-terminal domain-containing protein n=1 Tax=Gottschalkia acidurici (strain ATCC 7906 / DSM 604 / BCRC 14475 / CIP 104303 / KCTC 5404 / NCIMB 10678 / 9a) TaxID=1128398 RepID=K0AYE5_GOTA9|nr:YcxB family protein [Gottschalkia acidurici]AFS78803.1 hypothetical protein Curi_c17960 [Gottschalkia acidurici 9a]